MTRIEFLINEIRDVDEAQLVDYLSKFYVHEVPIKDECCNKFCIRNSGRYCISCPNHPMRNSNNTLKEEDINLLKEMLKHKNYFRFINYLTEKGYPVPTTIEVENLLESIYAS